MEISTVVCKGRDKSEEKKKWEKKMTDKDQKVF